MIAQCVSSPIRAERGVYMWHSRLDGDPKALTDSDL
jgi:hypothetical protein